MKLVTNLRADGRMNVGGLALAPSGSAKVFCSNDEIDEAVRAGAVTVTPSGSLVATDDVIIRGIAGGGRYSVGMKLSEIVAAALEHGYDSDSMAGVAGTGVTAVEAGNGAYRRTILTVDGVLPVIAGGASLGLGLLVYTLPAGAQVIRSSYMSMAIQQIDGNITADQPVVGLGSVIASGVVSTIAGTATFQDVLAGVTAADCDGTPSVSTFVPTVASGNTRNTGGVKAIYFNAAAAWSASGDATPGVVGTIVLDWVSMA